MKRISLLECCALAVVTALFSACSRDGGEAPEKAVQAAANAVPTDAETRQIYWRTCHGCHGSGAGGAPRTGDAVAWAPRLEQGMETLVNHAVHGYRAMPPRGLCFDCSDAEFAALIQLMSGATAITVPD